MSISNKLPWSICVISVAVAFWLLYKLVDQSITLDHQTQYTTTLEGQRKVLVEVLNSTPIGSPEKKVRDLLQQLAPDSTFDKGSNKVICSQVSFIFDNKRLAGVSLD